MTVVAERAGVSRGAAQHHFPTREALFTAALAQVSARRHEQMRAEVAELTATGRSTPAAIVELIFGLYTGPTFRAALALWTAAAADAALRAQIVPLEAHIGREVHRAVVEMLGVDEARPGVRETVQATLDLARGLGLADLLTDDSRRRRQIAVQWARILDTVVA